MLLLLLVFPPSDLVGRSLQALEASGGGRQGRHHGSPPDLLLRWVDGAGLPVPDPHQRRAPERYVVRPVRLLPADGAQHCRAVVVIASLAVAGRVTPDPVEIGPGLRPVACTQLVDVDGALSV